MTKKTPKIIKETRPTEDVIGTDGLATGQHVKDLIPDDGDESIGEQLTEQGLEGAPIVHEHRK
jgi:hypothetical protein